MTHPPSGPQTPPPPPGPKDVEVFQFPATGQSVRSVIRDGEPWFVAADDCMVLGYGGGARNAVARLPERMKGVAAINTPGGKQPMTVLNEAGAYRLVLTSTLPSAESFQDWLAEDVVPSIRQTGRYETVSLDELEVARRYVLALEAKKALESRVAELAPSAAAWDHLASGDGDFSVGDAAKILSRDPSITIGQGRLFTQLREWRWVFQGGDGRPRAMQTQVDCGRLSEIPQSHYHPRTGEIVLDPPQVRIKPKGLAEIHRRLGGSAPLTLNQSPNVGSFA